MKIKPFFATTMILAGMLFFGCATKQGFVSVSDPSQSFELGRLSFLAPPGEGWEYEKRGSSPAQSMFFLKRGDLETPGFSASVWQYRADVPVTSEKDLWEYVLSPFRDAIDSQEQFEILKTECGHDESFAKVGVRCFVEGRHHLKGNFWIDGMNPGDVVTVRGHAYAFVHPDDNRLIGAVDYFQRGLPEQLTADTKTLLSEFARGVTFRK
jgi:hypothetical protein